MLQYVKSVVICNTRTFKNFGHKRQPVPTITFLWHGFLTFTFIGLGLEWKKIAMLLFGEDHEVEDVPWKGSEIPVERNPHTR